MAPGCQNPASPPSVMPLINGIRWSASFISPVTEGPFGEFMMLPFVHQGTWRLLPLQAQSVLDRPCRNMPLGCRSC